MSKPNLVIVESPAKAKTIEKYLGSEYSVRSSFGHIRDLPKKGLSIDKDNNFEPKYEIDPSKKTLINELKRAAKQSNNVYLASDEDREGEAIAWHLCKALGLDTKNTKRIVFHEITKPAIEHAIKNPRIVDENLVNAQQARRVLDRLVGYELSPVLWKKVKTGLSAGRVQSVAVRLIVEREREIARFKSTAKFKIIAYFNVKEKELKAELQKNIDSQEKAEELLNTFKNSVFSVDEITKKSGTRSPSPPFITSSLQQEASSKLGFSVKQTMMLAQRLYENGHITYMRTDSTNLSTSALADSKKYITSILGPEYHQSRQYKTKSVGAQEAHEAIRPSSFSTTSAGDDSKQKKLYELIWRRALASQMSSAKFDRTELTIKANNTTEVFVAKGEIMTFDGFQKIYKNVKEDIILPKVTKNDTLPINQVVATQSYDRPPARYSEASLVKGLEELGIGRPSTYAPTISTIQTRGYIEKRDSEGTLVDLVRITLKNGKIKKDSVQKTSGVEKGKLVPTHLADITTDFLMQYFGPIVDYKFTARAEDDFDKIADGKHEWHQMIKDFYKDFFPLIEKSDSASRQETSKARILGKDPKTNKPIIARYGRYGGMLQMGEVESEEKPKFATLPAGTTVENVTLDKALEMFKLPKDIGFTEDGKPIKASIGRFGPYIQVEGLFVSIKPHDPLTITEDQARELYAEKLQKDAKKIINKFEDGLAVLRGPYGPYVTDGKKNARLPKDIDPEKIDQKEIIKLLETAPARKSRRFKKRK